MNGPVVVNAVAELAKETARRLLTKKLENVQLARRLWKLVKPEDVIRGLNDWTCGTQACFGGHLATWPEFQEIGVKASMAGSPQLSGCFGASAVATELFGDESIFRARWDHEIDEYWSNATSDHELVMIRLDYAEDRLNQQLKELS